MKIELRNVWFSYARSSDPVVRGVSLTVESGELVLVVGPNAAGKTTILKILALLYKPTRGAVLVDGEEFWSMPEDRRYAVRKGVVYVHEKPILLRRSVLDNVALGLRIRGVRNAEERALEVLKLLRIEDLAYRPWRELSAGQAQLVSIARALAVKPRILVLDEPFAHLDKHNRIILMQVLKRLRDEGMGMVIASHWPPNDFAPLSPERIVEVAKGCVVSTT